MATGFEYSVKYFDLSDYSKTADPIVTFLIVSIALIFPVLVVRIAALLIVVIAIAVVVAFRWI